MPQAVSVPLGVYLIVGRAENPPVNKKEIPLKGLTNGYFSVKCEDIPVDL
jgi:hypothetical protein